MKLFGEAKRKRDNEVRKFAVEYPHYTQKEIGFKFGIDRTQINRILGKSRDLIPEKLSK